MMSAGSAMDVATGRMSAVARAGAAEEEETSGGEESMTAGDHPGGGAHQGMAGHRAG